MENETTRVLGIRYLPIALPDDETPICLMKDARLYEDNG
jgi:hypothetical protein